METLLNGLGKKIGLFSRTFNVPSVVRDIIKSMKKGLSFS